MSAWTLKRVNVKRNLARRASTSSPFSKLQTRTSWRTEATMSSLMSIKRYVRSVETLSIHQGAADTAQGDLGHTDLQEDLEFHSSSKLSQYNTCFAPY